MKVLIIGSEGFIGSNCITFFLRAGADVTGVDLISTPKVFGYRYIPHTTLSGYASIFKEHKYDFCINASGNGSVPVSINEPLFDFAANCSEPVALLEAIRLYNPDCRLVHISSAAVYGTPSQLPVTEDSAPNPLSPYGWHKLISEQLCKEYVQLYRMPIAVVRPFSVYGPGLRKQLLWDIFQKSKQTKQIQLFGNGKESRDFIFISDLVRAISVIFQQAPMQGEVYNLASGIETHISEIAKTFCSLLHSEIQVEFNGVVRAGDPLNWVAGIERVRALGFAPETSLAEGLQKTVSWMKQLSE